MARVFGLAAIFYIVIAKLWFFHEESGCFPVLNVKALWMYRCAAKYPKSIDALLDGYGFVRFSFVRDAKMYCLYRPKLYCVCLVFEPCASLIGWQGLSFRMSARTAAPILKPDWIFLFDPCILRKVQQRCLDVFLCLNMDKKLLFWCHIAYRVRTYFESCVYLKNDIFGVFTFCSHTQVFCFSVSYHDFLVGSGICPQYNIFKRGLITMVDCCPECSASSFFYSFFEGIFRFTCLNGFCMSTKWPSLWSPCTCVSCSFWTFIMLLNTSL